MNFWGRITGFVTKFYTDERNILYVKGSGDPLLTSESITAIAHELKKRGIHTIRSYVLDDSAFQLENPRPDGSLNSANPYDAGNGGLSVNFNSITIIKKENGSVISGEKQTPTIELAKEIGAFLPPGKHRVNIGAYDLQGNISPSLRYSAELMHSIFQKAGINSTMEFRQGKIPDSAKKIFVYSSDKTVKDVVRLCMHYSSNFLANQLALAAGAKMYGRPATWVKARKTLSFYASKRLGIPEDDLHIQEGSGLSRETFVTPAAMMSLVEAFTPYRDLLPVKQGYRLKSGTLKGVYCYAGFIDTPKGTAMVSLLLNQPVNNRNHLIQLLGKRLLYN